MNQKNLITELTHTLIDIISDTNGITLTETISLLSHHPALKTRKDLVDIINEFQTKLHNFYLGHEGITTLLEHIFSKSLFQFFKNFPLTYHEEHIHLTGSLTAEFIFPRLKKLLDGPDGAIYLNKIKEVYGDSFFPIDSVEKVNSLIRLKKDERFSTYLKILYLPKLILTSKEAHEEAAYHMATELYNKYNIGKIRLKFTLSRQTQMAHERLPLNANGLSEEDVIIGLYNGFMKFKKERPQFTFILSPCFRKEPDFFNQEKYTTKKEDFEEQVKSILEITRLHPYIKEYLTEVDTVGDEKDVYKKKHFLEMKNGLRRLQYQGLKIRSHHGETWKILRLGVQSVDNALNIWQIDTLEHGLSLGINPNYYFQRVFQRALEQNQQQRPLCPQSTDYAEIVDMDWQNSNVLDKILNGIKLNESEIEKFLKTKFHTAREIEQYQHDVLNRIIDKNVSLVALPSSNLKLTGAFLDYKDHPFSWWEQKGVLLGVGTDNYITLNTNFIEELLILLYSNPNDLKITKLLMVATQETRRAYIGNMLWEMRKSKSEKIKC